eukprot:6200794-Pleurochrysis_carterae.AAC.3
MKSSAVRGAGAGAGAGHTSAVAPGRWRSQAMSAMRATGSQNLGSRARVLCKYACGRVQIGKLCMRSKRSSALRRFQIKYSRRGTAR